MTEFGRITPTAAPEPNLTDVIASVLFGLLKQET
jgi:hypothetical protein